MKKIHIPETLYFRDTPEIRRFLNPLWFTIKSDLQTDEKFYGIELHGGPKPTDTLEFRVCRMFPEDLLALKLVGIPIEIA